MRMDYKFIFFINLPPPITMIFQHFITKIQNSQKATTFRNLVFLVLLHAFSHAFETSLKLKS